MATISKATSVQTVQRPSTFAAYLELTKPRISSMVLITVVVAAVIGSPTWPGLVVVLNAAIAIALIAASGNAFNMYFERYTDFLMPRTAERPLPAQRLSSTQVAAFGAICFGAGFAFMATAINLQTTLCGVGTWMLYVLIYTPLKTKTHLNTEVGAIAGAMPILMGCLATSGTINAVGWMFFAVLLCWQFPHFMAIAWMYRDHYKSAGLKMLTVTEPSGAAAGRKAVIYSIATWLVSLLPIITFGSTLVSISFVIMSSIAAYFYFRASVDFSNNRTDQTARKLLRVSISYLPAYMIMLVIGCLIS